jgi:hypothetical protein
MIQVWKSYFIDFSVRPINITISYPIQSGVSEIRNTKNALTYPYSSYWLHTPLTHEMF